ncbi:MAG: hemolysin family protein [Halanaerobiales bacterium]|nr:hemolysin family protein [Bacillota bacterium]HOA40938.1 hemolysin family protein [Halanaerobiales bacterium]HPZ62757.1 hemolysin family protein [Halanaerobiales bacterium]HQD04335.1 hemolysin family protein [Halanaerobiales bacterium]
MISELLLLMLLVALNAFFAATEIALISLNDNKIRYMAEEGNKKASLLIKILGEPSKFLATIQIGITLAGFLASAFAADTFAGPLVELIKKTNLPISETVLKNVSVILITIILSYFTLVFGELVPKRLAMKKAESISFFVVTPLRALSTITSPFVKLLTVSTNFIVRLFGIDPAAEEEMVTEEEIRMLVDVGEEKGAIDESEKEMINNIFEFDNKVVSDIMTHRTEIVGIPTSASIKDIIEIVKSAKFTRYPVYEDNIDDIIGILNIKDLIQLTEDRNQFDLNQIIRQPYYVPASKKADELFRELQSTKTHMAVAIDEYGGTAGIVTIEDLLEEIVGNIFDEYDVEEKEFEKIDDNTFIINGVASLDRVTEFLKVDLPIDDYDTLSGFLIGQLGRIPEAGETPVVEYDEIIFKVEEIEEKRIAKVKACRT